MQLRNSPLSTVISLIGIGGLVGTAFLVANLGNSYLLLLFAGSNALCALCVLGIRNVNQAEKKYERQLLEIEMDAHKFDVTKEELDDYTQTDDPGGLHERVLAEESRSEKLAVMLRQIGYSRTHRILRAIRDGRVAA